MFERFTESALKTIMLAQEEARRLGHNFVGTEQILLGLIGEGRGIAAKTLKSAGVSLKDARVEVEKIIGRGSGFVAVEIPFTPRVKRLLELSSAAAQGLGHSYIGTEHLLLGLIREGGGVASRVLENMHVDAQEISKELTRILGGTDGGLLSPDPKIPTDTSDLKCGAFGWYSADAILTVQRAWDIVETTGGKEIAPEHLALAVLRDDATVCGALKAENVNLEDMRRELFKGLEHGNILPAKGLPFSTEAQEVLKFAWLEASDLKEVWITKECIFLGLVRQEDGALIQVLKTLGVDPNVLRKSVEDAVKADRQEKAAAFTKANASASATAVRPLHRPSVG